MKTDNVYFPEGEIFIPVVGFEGLYEVSNMQRVRTLSELSIKRGFEFIGQFNHRKGYKVVSFYKNGRQKTHKMHRVVAQAFLANPLNLPEVNHKDTNKKNNFLSNLEWSTGGDNQRHAYKNGCRKAMAGELNPKSILSEEQVLYVFNSKEKTATLARELGVSESCVQLIRNGRNWSKLTGKYRK
jgi:hypothetical protein